MSYFDAYSACPKCGGQFVATRYEKETDTMCRKCERCRHDWMEKPLDSLNSVRDTIAKGESE